MIRATVQEHSAGKLIICPTPLGNLGDMPPRARTALETCDVVCCEDTRVTGQAGSRRSVSRSVLSAWMKRPSGKRPIACSTAWKQGSAFVIARMQACPCLRPRSALDRTRHTSASLLLRYCQAEQRLPLPMWPVVLPHRASISEVSFRARQGSVRLCSNRSVRSMRCSYSMKARIVSYSARGGG